MKEESFVVVPRSFYSDNFIKEKLSFLGLLERSEVEFLFNEVRKRGYLVKRSFIVDLMKRGDHELAFEKYKKTNDGKFEKCTFSNRGNSRKSSKMREKLKKIRRV